MSMLMDSRSLHGPQTSNSNNLLNPALSMKSMLENSSTKLKAGSPALTILAVLDLIASYICIELRCIWTGRLGPRCDSFDRCSRVHKRD